MRIKNTAIASEQEGDRETVERRRVSTASKASLQRCAWQTP